MHKYDNTISIKTYCNGPEVTIDYVQQYNERIDRDNLQASNGCDLHITLQDTMYYVKRFGNDIDRIPNAFSYRFLESIASNFSIVSLKQDIYVSLQLYYTLNMEDAGSILPYEGIGPILKESKK